MIIFCCHDYPISDEDKQLWMTYRQELRDITKQKVTDNDFQAVKIPVSPRPQDQIVDMFNLVGNTYANAVDLPTSSIMKENVEGLGLNSIIEKWTEITLKVQILRGIASLKMPAGLTTDELTAIEQLIPYSS